MPHYPTLAASVLLLIAGCRSPRIASDGDRIPLRFAWPSPLTLTVDRTFERTDQRPDKSTAKPITAVTRYRWQGATVRDQYAIGFSDFEVVTAPPTPASNDPLVQIEHMARILEPLLPTIVVDPQARPTNVEGLPALRGFLLSRYQTIPGLADDPGAQRLIGALTTEQVLVRHALDDWQRLVQVWHGNDVTIGSSRSAGGSAPLPGGASMRDEWSYVVPSTVPCDEHDTAGRCVRLVIRHVPQFPDVASGMRTLLGNDFSAAWGVPPTATLAIENTYTTDTQPATLVPSHYEKVKRWTISWTTAKGVPRTIGRTDRWTYRFTQTR